MQFLARCGLRATTTPEKSDVFHVVGTLQGWTIKNFAASTVSDDFTDDTLPIAASRQTSLDATLVRIFLVA